MKYCILIVLVSLSLSVFSADPLLDFKFNNDDFVTGSLTETMQVAWSNENMSRNGVGVFPIDSESHSYIEFKDDSAGLTGMGELTMEVDLMLDSASYNKRMRPVWLHSAYGLEIRGNRVRVLLYTENDSVSLYSSPVDDLYAGKWNNFRLTYNSRTGFLKLDINGINYLTVKELSGNIRMQKRRELTIGSDPWGAKFYGQIDNLRVYNLDLSEMNSNKDIVYNTEQLIETLRDTKSKRTIYLAPGNYSDIYLNGLATPTLKYDFPVTITSLDEKNKAIINRMSIREVSNIHFDKIKFKYEFDGKQPIWDKPFIVTKVDDFSVKDCIVEGDIVEPGENNGKDLFVGFATGIGLTITESTKIKVESNEFFHFHRAATFSKINSLFIARNNIHSLRSDGFNFAQVENVSIENNHFHDFKRAKDSLDHADMIQFWTNGTKVPSKNIVIKRNFLNSGQFLETQSIFMRNDQVDQGLAGLEMYYQNIHIENNVIHNAHSHGITIGETKGLVIRNNILLKNRDSAQTSSDIHLPSVNVNGPSLDVEIYNNVAEKINISNPKANIVRYENNLIYQHIFPQKKFYVGELFVNALAGKNSRLEDFYQVPNGVLEQLGVGSNLSAFPYQGLRGYIKNTAGIGFELKRHEFEAFFLDGNDLIDLKNPIYNVSWDFGDGFLTTEVNPSHEFQKAGFYEVTMVIKRDGILLHKLNKTIEVQTPELLKLDYSKSISDQSDFPNILVRYGSSVLEKEGLRFNGPNSFLAYKYSNEFRGHSNYTISLEYKKDVGHEDQSIRLIYVTGTGVIQVNADSVKVSASTDQGEPISLFAKNLGIQNSQWHKISFAFSQDTGTASLYIDGKLVIEQNGIKGKQYDAINRDFNIGTPFGGENFHGLIKKVSFVSY